jgi:streptogramin lyase
MTPKARFPASARVDSLAVGFGDVWVVSSSTATLYRVDPRLTAVDHVDLGRSAGRPAAVFGAIWITLADRGGDTLLVNPRTLGVQEDLGSPQGSTVPEVGAFGSVWDYDARRGTVERWNPSTYQLHQLIPVTHPPFYYGSCLTSIAAGADAVWVTLAPAVNYACSS